MSDDQAETMTRELRIAYSAEPPEIPEGATRVEVDAIFDAHRNEVMAGAQRRLELTDEDLAILARVRSCTIEDDLVRLPNDRGVIDADTLLDYLLNGEPDE